MMLYLLFLECEMNEIKRKRGWNLHIFLKGDIVRQHGDTILHKIAPFAKSRNWKDEIYFVVVAVLTFFGAKKTWETWSRLPQ